MGRNKIFKDGKEEIGIYLTPDEAKMFDEIRCRERKVGTEVGRIAIQEYIRLHSEGNDTSKLDNWNLDPNTQGIPNLFAEESKIIEDYRASNQEERKKGWNAIQKRF